MKPHAQAVREAQAWDRILGAVTRQAQAAGVKTEGLDATHRDPSLQRLFRMEALAAHLEGVEAAQAPKPAKAESKAEGKVSK